MRKILGLVAIMAATITNQAALAQDSYTFDCFERQQERSTQFARIYGATEKIDNNVDYPWMVNLYGHPELYGSNRTFCGGALINDDLVLTAAHCIPDGTYTVRRAAPDGAPSGEERRVLSTRVHGQYQKTKVSLDYDIALIRVDAPFSIARRDLPVVQSKKSKLSQHFGQPDDCVRVIGWGKTETSTGSETLLAADIRVWDQSDCADAYDNITHEKLCAGFPKGKIDSCSGDSGGPLFARGGVTGSLLVGIVSYGAGCGEAGKPGVYARLSELREWISETAKGMYP